jgi:hypothetical protein
MSSFLKTDKVRIEDDGRSGPFSTVCEGVFRIPRQDAETIAESAAFVVGAHYGFDTGIRSFPYVALWARDKKVLEDNLGAIRRVSTTIMDSLEKIQIRTPV